MKREHLRSLAMLMSLVTVLAVSPVLADSATRQCSTIVYRGQLNLLSGEPASNNDPYTKTMHFRVYDGESATEPLWKVDRISVKVNADGSFITAFGDEALAALIATGKVTHVGVAIGSQAGRAVELKPRRELRPVAAVNRALMAEGAAPDVRVGNLATEQALTAADVTVSRFEATGTVTAPGAGPVKVTPLTVGEGETTTLLRGSGVTVFGAKTETLADVDSAVRGQVLGSPAPADGFALISSKQGGARNLRIPAVVQYCRAGESVRAPTTEPGGVKVTFFPFIGKEGK